MCKASNGILTDKCINRKLAAKGSHPVGIP